MKLIFNSTSISYAGLILIYCTVFGIHSYVYEEKYLGVPVDHFSFADNRIFALRYCVNDSFWEPTSGPIFFYAGNEASIETFIDATGFLWESAVRFQALVLFVEHRYYGKSLPFGNSSFTEAKYYSYLTTQQVLADFVDVIYHIRQSRNLFLLTNGKQIPNPVIAFGGSYGGMLAAWMRMKYPAVIEGALASSAPIWYFYRMTPCDAFDTKLTSIYSEICQYSVKNVQTFWNELTRITKTEQGRLWVSKTFKLCDLLRTDDDVNNLASSLEDMFVAAAMANYPYPTDFLKPLPANPVTVMCSFINVPNLSGEALVDAMSKVASVYFNYTRKEKCLDLKKGAYDNLGSDAWGIQTCSDMSMPFCSNQRSDILRPTNWTIEDMLEHCSSSYGLYPIPNVIEKLYGGKNLDAASNIIFSNGQLDPWMSGGVIHYPSSSITTIVLEGAAHHLDLRAENKNDPYDVKMARKMYETKFKEWIQAYYRKREIANSEIERQNGLSASTADPKI